MFRVARAPLSISDIVALILCALIMLPLFDSSLVLLLLTAKRFNSTDRVHVLAIAEQGIVTRRLPEPRDDRIH